MRVKMVYNKKDLAKSLSPNKLKRYGRRRFSGGGVVLKPSTSGSTTMSVSSRAESSTNIKVIVRVRPHNERELQNNCKPAIEVVDDKMLIFDPKEEQNPFFYQGVAQKGRDLLKRQNKEMQFMFDRVFDVSCTNEDVFNGSTKDIIASLLEGYNCSVFAYGATGAGKTHTMLGKDDDPGITYRTVAELFSQIEMQSAQRDFNLGVTYLEVYNENVQDLLHKTGPLHIRDDGRCGIVVAGLKVITIHSAEDLLALLTKGNKNRTQHPTDANQESSRSHAVFQVYVNITNKLDGQIKQVKLSMIDLAGSERASVTGCKGARFKEGANINKSLLALGNCINNLADGVKHIPYRDSKLTRLLKDSLGGNCQTVMVANISPTSFSYEDTYNTLRYANRAKKIKTNVKKNIVSCQMHISGYIKMVEEQKKEINTLKLKLSTYEENGSVQISLKNIKINDSKMDENLSELTDQVLELYEKKKLLNEKFLSLESADKVLCCRIQYKKAADSRLCNLTEAIDTSDEQNTSGKLRINKSVHYFKRQRENIRNQMESIWNDLCITESKIQELNLQIKSKDLMHKSTDKLALKISEIERARTQQQFEHAKKISSLQQCETESLYIMMRMMSKTLQNYYNMMRGYGTMTDQMKKEFKQLIKSLEGVKNIKWSDSNAPNQEEDIYKLICLCTDQLENPTYNELPIFMPSIFNDEEQISSPVQTKLNLTFDSPAETTNATNCHNSSIILDEKSNSLTDNQNDTIKNGSIDAEKLNNTFNLQENNIRKRILMDRNQVGIKVSANKLLKDISPKFMQKSSLQINSSLEKENKNAQRHTTSVMSAKSIAILNRLKAERNKQPLSLNKASSTDSSNGSLKSVRGKERRGLIVAHPYEKSNTKQKIPPAPPSTRIPW